MNNVQDIISQLGLKYHKVYNLYIFGSKLYKTDNENSDTDYIIIYDQEEKRKEFHKPELNINCELYSIEGFNEELKQHKIHILECLFSSDEYKYETIKFNAIIDPFQLRRSISAVVSNAWDKARKKIHSGELNVGQKSLFHCFRILHYGIQLIDNNKINDFEGKKFSTEYSDFSKLLNEIKTYNNWNDLKLKYKDFLNTYVEKFKGNVSDTYNRVTPNNIKTLKENEIFVFGANESYRHGKGAALQALRYFGARNGVNGFCGQSYGIPTKDKTIKYTLSLNKIDEYVKEFLIFTKENPQYIFLVTEIGCGLAKYTPDDIAPLFKEAFSIKNIYLPKSFWKIILKNI